MLPFDRKDWKKAANSTCSGSGTESPAASFPYACGSYEPCFLREVMIPHGNKDTGVKAGICGHMNANNQACSLMQKISPPGC